MAICLKTMRYVHHKNSFYKQAHMHNLCELAYYMNGNGSVSRGGDLFEYDKGTIHLVHNGILHDENNETESKIMLLYFEMPSEFLPSGIYQDTNGAVLALLRELRFEMQGNLLYKQEMVDSILMQILLILKRKLFPQITENVNFYHIIKYIDENFQFDLNIRDIAAKSFYSYDRFRHVFKEYTGFAPHEYINNKRIDLAKFLIDMDTSISLSALAEECGYTSLSQFSNAFRVKTGLSPSQYKEKIKNRK